jgi:2-oxo-4-hydroxy-4-carboxy-5-ureidoimidazoline decarboxylase
VTSWLNTASQVEARDFLTRCCGAQAWVERMLARRPFASDSDVADAAREEWFSLAPDDWLEAFRHHPRIGDRVALRARFPRTADLSAEEQRGVEGASDATLDALAEGNRAYEEKFGFIFLVCASGKSAEEMLAILRERLSNDPHTELRIAAEEQAEITALRLRG